MAYIAITHRFSGHILFSQDIEDNSLRRTLEAAVHVGTNLTGAILSSAILSSATLRGTILRGADLSGANLPDTDLSGAILRHAHLSGADLCGADLRGADLSGAILYGADLCGADLRGAHLRGADLTGAILTGAILSGADLVVPGVPQLDQRILAALAAGGTLNMATWHTCQTTHCRAGWAIHLAGEAGAALEAQLGPATAGALIYHASAGYIPDFYGTDEEALADIAAHAAAQEPTP